MARARYIRLSFVLFFLLADIVHLALILLNNICCFKKKSLNYFILLKKDFDKNKPLRDKWFHRSYYSRCIHAYRHEHEQVPLHTNNHI